MVLHISSGSPFEKKIGYSRAVIDGNMAYVSGTTGYDYKTMVMPEDAGQQARNAFATIQQALEEAGGTIKEVFADIRPAATMVVCGLTRPEMKLEIEVTARFGAHGR